MDFKLVKELLDKVNMVCLDIGVKYMVESNSGIYVLVEYMCTGSSDCSRCELLTTKFASELILFLHHVYDYMGTLSMLCYNNDKSTTEYSVYLGTQKLGTYTAESFCVACVKALNDKNVFIRNDYTPVSERKLKLELPSLTYDDRKFCSELSVAKKLNDGYYTEFAEKFRQFQKSGLK